MLRQSLTSGSFLSASSNMHLKSHNMNLKHREAVKLMVPDTSLPNFTFSLIAPLLMLATVVVPCSPCMTGSLDSFRRKRLPNIQVSVPEFVGHSFKEKANNGAPLKN